MRTHEASRRPALACAAVAAALAGCAVGPDYHAPEAPKVAAYVREPLAELPPLDGAPAQRLAYGADVPAQWWQLFRSPALNALVEQALRHNPDLRAARASLRAAQESAQAARGGLFPAFDANVQSSRQKTAAELSSALDSGEPLYTLHTAQLTVSYQLDAFGGVRRQAEAAQAQAEAERFQFEAARLTLAANVALAALQEASLRAQIAATRTSVRAGTQTLALMQRQHELGAIAMADVLAQQAQQAQTEAMLAPLLKQLAQQHHQLLALAGKLPGDDDLPSVELGDLQLPAELPLSLPSRLVEQRPDVRSAAAQLHAATAQVGVATADLLPQLTLSASAGRSGIDASRLFGAGTAFWSVVGGLTQPMFHGGTLVHRKRAAEAGLDQAASQYESAVVAAFQNVADALQALQHDSDALRAQLAAEQAAAQSLAVARRSLELGAVSTLAVLNAEQTWQQAVIALAQARAARHADTIALFQALGGGWWGREDNVSP
jgi:NodT family efflux transporter outer membrane factor (OMF) lipoprotein